MIIYLGCPIDTARKDTPPQEQIREVAELIQKAIPISVMYNPFSAFCNANSLRDEQDLSEMEFIIQMNMDAVDRSHLAVFVWNGSPSYGVPVEIERCYEKEIPFVIWNRTPRPLGLYLRHRAMSRKSNAIVNSEKELHTYLTSLHNAF